MHYIILMSLPPSHTHTIVSIWFHFTSEETKPQRSPRLPEGLSQNTSFSSQRGSGLQGTVHLRSFWHLPGLRLGASGGTMPSRGWQSTLAGAWNRRHWQLERLSEGDPPHAHRVSSASRFGAAFCLFFPQSYGFAVLLCF